MSQKPSSMVLQPSRSSSAGTSTVGHHSSFNLHVMQLNAWLIPVRPNFPHCLDFHALTRANRMALWLEEEVLNHRLDIAIFQEVWTPWRSVVAASIHSMFCCRLFGRSVIEKTLSKSLPYITKVQGSMPCDCTKRFFDSGLVIASRYPIMEEEFRIYPSGSPHDALSSKGILVAALRRPDNGIVIVGSSHLDAGDDDSFKIDQLRIALSVFKEFTAKIQAKYDSLDIVATLFGSDMNIDGIEFWETENSYAQVRTMMNEQGFQDSWLLTPREIPPADVIKAKAYRPEKQPQLGITSDQHECVKRLDYVWVCPGPIGTRYGGPPTPAVVHHTAPQQEMMDAMRRSGSSRQMAKNFGVSAKTELNDGIQWQSSAAMRDMINESIKNGEDKKATKKIQDKVDLHDRAERLSDHAAIFAKLHFFPQ